MNGKTIGKTKPGPDMSVVDETIRGQEAFRELERSGNEEMMTSRERGFHNENISLKRQLDVERARVAVLMANGGKGTLAPITADAELVAEFDRRVLSMGDMTDEAILREARSLVADVKSRKAAKSAWLAEVEEKVGTRLKSKTPNRPNEPWVKLK